MAKLKRGTVLFGLGLIVLSAVAGAADQKTDGLVKFTGKAYPGKLDPSSIVLSKAKFEAEHQKALVRGKRSIATNADFESQMSPALVALRKTMVSIHTGVELDAALENLNTAYEAIDQEATTDNSKYNTASDGTRKYYASDRDFRYFAAQLLPLRCLKGITFRFRPIAESSLIVDSELVSLMYRLASDIDIYTPRTEDIPTTSSQDKAAKDQAVANKEISSSEAAFEYLSQPYEGIVLMRQGQELQEMLMNDCYPALLKSANRIEKLDLNQPIVWDNKMFFGVGSFADDLDQYKQIGEAEKHLAMATKYTGMHYISFFRSYSIQDYFKLQMEMARLTYQDAFRSFFSVTDMASGVDLKKRTDLIKTYKQTYVMYVGAYPYMRAAYANLARSVQELKITWDEIKGRSDDQRRILNPGFFKGFTRDTDNILGTWTRIAPAPPADDSVTPAANASAEIHSKITDAVVSVNLQNFYYNPPADLKDLLPTHFDSTQKAMIPHSFTVNYSDGNGNLIPAKESRYKEYRNYSYRKADKWDLVAYQRIFPSVTDATQVPSAIRVLNEASGGGIEGVSFLPFFH